MRIGIDCRLWNETGVGRYVRNLVGYLGEIDKENEYVLFVRDPQEFKIQNSLFERKLAQSKQFKIVKANIRWHTIDEQIRLPLILAKEKLDLVHFPYFSVPILYKGKFVVTIHDLIPLHFATGLATTLPTPLYKAKRVGYKTILRQGIKEASKIIAVSHTTKDEIIKYLKVSPDKVVVTHEGVDEQVAKNKKQSLIGKKEYFLYVGNAYPHKNLDRLFQAFGILRSEYSDIQLILVGKEDYFYRKLKERIKELDLAKHIVFHGEVTDEELSALYQHAKALIIPSLMEGFGLPALEAMVNKCLILASDIPALRETCGETAIYFNPYDAEDIKEKMIRCLTDNFEGKIKNGIKRAKLFSWKKMAQQTQHIYQEVIH